MRVRFILVSVCLPLLILNGNCACDPITRRHGVCSLWRRPSPSGFFRSIDSTSRTPTYFGGTGYTRDRVAAQALRALCFGPSNEWWAHTTLIVIQRKLKKNWPVRALVTAIKIKLIIDNKLHEKYLFSLFPIKV